MKCILLSAIYDSSRKKVVLKFYEPKSQILFLWADNSNHTPFGYSTMQQGEKVRGNSDVIKIEKVLIKDCLTDSTRPMSKISTSDYYTLQDADIATWETDIKYYHSYLYDKNITMGAWYYVTENEIVPVEPNADNEMIKTLQNIDHTVEKDKFIAQMKYWAELLSQEIPQIKRLAFDIEVESTDNRLPDSQTAPNPISAIGFESDNFHKVFLLKREVELGEKTENSVLFDSEKEMIEKAFEIIGSYPMVLTYNGDEFDMPYLCNRALKLGIEQSPLMMMRKNATLKRGIHIDLYPFFKNNAIRVYTFSNRYPDLKLDTITNELIDEHKLDHGDLNTVPIYELGKYCYNDARITYKLTSYNSDLIMNVLLILARVGKLPIDDINRLGLNNWAKSLFCMHHRQNNVLIPRRAELDEKTVEVKEKSVIEGKQYRGALIMAPVPGIHFDVKVMDFASLYPSIIKNYNLSYETVRCPHEECKKEKLPELDHWSCKKNIGVIPLLIGSLMELRIHYFKPLANNESLPKEEQEKYDIITQTLKIILNGCYGMMGYEKSAFFYLPAVESISGIGRYIISDTIRYAKVLGVNVLYSDTDSCFVKEPTDDQVDKMIKTAKNNYGISLEVDKEYRYIILSNRKKNYLGVKKNGQLDIKGLTGKKSHTPPFIKSLFNEVTSLLKPIITEAQFSGVKAQIKEIVATKYNEMVEYKIPLEQMAVSLFLAKNPSEYKKNIPQHLKAAQMLDKEIKVGEHIRYIKTCDKAGVKPIELAKIQDINIAKYRELMSATLSQILDPMDIDFEATIGFGRKTTIDEFFG